MKKFTDILNEVVRVDHFASSEDEMKKKGSEGRKKAANRARELRSRGEHVGKQGAGRKEHGDVSVERTKSAKSWKKGDPVPNGYKVVFGKLVKK